MTNKELNLCTTFELECIINNFTWYENSFLTKVKRELDKRHRKRLIKQQFKNLIYDYEKNTGKDCRE